jgi:hypothetical protein
MYGMFPSVQRGTAQAAPPHQQNERSLLSGCQMSLIGLDNDLEDAVSLTLFGESLYPAAPSLLTTCQGLFDLTT